MIEFWINVEDIGIRICWRIGYGKWEEKGVEDDFKVLVGKLVGYLLRRNML